MAAEAASSKAAPEASLGVTENLSNATKAASRAAEIASRVEAPKAALTASETALMVALVEAASRLTASEALPRATAAVLTAGGRRRGVGAEARAVLVSEAETLEPESRRHGTGAGEGGAARESQRSRSCSNCPNSRFRNFRELLPCSSISLVTRQREEACLLKLHLSTESESAESILGVVVLLRMVGVVQDSIARLSTGVDSEE